MLVELTENQCRFAMENGDFSREVIASAPQVAIVLTQAWCPEWRVMRQLITPGPDHDDTRVYFVEYDQQSWYEEFMTFKERTYGNEFVPYLRYYRDGELIGESNFVGPDQFWEVFSRGRVLPS